MRVCLSSFGGMAAWADADRRLDLSLRWVIADVALSALLVWITVVSVTTDAYVDQYGPIEGTGWILALAPAVLVPTRRWAPLPALVAVTALYVAISTVQGDSNAPLAAPFYAYAVGMSRPTQVSGPIIAVAASVLSIGTLAGPGDPDPLTAIVWFLLLGSGWLVATSIRTNQHRAERLEADVRQLEVEQAEIARQAEADERARIAHELHDAVGHAVNVIVLQAGAARLARDPERALDAVEQIERLGRNALGDLDQLLGLLRETGDEPARVPARTVADIIDLVDELRAAGADIALDHRCDGELDSRTGAAAFRIAQESLTNALKHAGDARIVVTLSDTPSEFHLTVADDGAGAQTTRMAHGGRGIPGMVERAKVLGGHLTARPQPGRGFAVEATLPKTAIDPTTPAPGSAGATHR